MPAAAPAAVDGTSRDAGHGAGGRSINLALAARGMRALEQAGALDAIRPLLLPMRGRIVHEVSGATRFLPYGQTPSECIWSVSRAALNERLHALARERGGIEYRFGHECVGFDAATHRVRLRSSGGETTIQPAVLLATDGAGSIVRRELAAAGRIEASEELLDHGYKELLIPARADGTFALDPKGLHIWPRGGFMLIALPNLDGSFTATLFLPQRGTPGFDALTPANAAPFFAREFPDAHTLLPDLAREYAARPVGMLGTVRCHPWSHMAAGGRHALLVGDAAHAIVPFHGQGMNAAFEDCACLDRLLGEMGPDWPRVIARFEDERRDNTRAIAAMALENYVEMRDGVRDPAFERRARLAFELERRFPGRFIPRYSMVMFHPEIPYAEAERRGRIQAAILDEALAAGTGATTATLAARLVEERL
jgi:kynurenine 3-monooxygenase